MRLLYFLVKDFGWAVVLFTLVVKAVSFPLALKQQKNTAVSQLFTPRVQEIQKKYRGNQQKLQEEMAKLQKEGYNPAGGCGSMILTMIILFGIIDVVYKPLTHMEPLDKDTITKIQTLSKQAEYAEIMLTTENGEEFYLEFTEEKENVPAYSENEREKLGKFILDNLSDFTDEAAPFADTTKSALKSVEGKYRTLQRELHSVRQFALHKEDGSFNSLSEATRQKLDSLQENMLFLGAANLGQIPQFSEINALWFIAAFAFLCAVLQVIVQQAIQKKSMPNMPNAGAMKMMLVVGPLFSLFISFSLPAGAGLYWAVSYLFMIGQSLVIYKFWPPEVMREEAAARMKAKFGGVDVTAKVVDIDDAGNEVVKEEKLSDMSGKEQKEYYRKKLEAARKADLEKYGNEEHLSLDSVPETPEQAENPEDSENEEKSENDEGEN
ncbi:MAG: YidC/Oxa1 family membrane protein insertase [Oscillospiraceae bacterium]|nr:YidC/Oxa1 family membrane protein insertase [Oscillospiraceae bacterium]